MQIETQQQQAGQLDTPRPGPGALVDALNDTFGKHPGKRASHAKGFFAVGTFTPAPEAGLFAHSELFKGRSAEALIRFSIGGGNSAVSDKSRTVRGMSVRVSSGAESWDLLMVSEPVFFAATPESFVSFLAARVPDPVTRKPDPAKVAAHNERFPDGKLQPALLAAHGAPHSYARTPYFANNAFLFEGADGKLRPARIVAEPALGTSYLTDAEEASFPDHFLEEELAERLQDGPLAFQLAAQLPAPADSLVDPSQQWTGAGTVILGTLRIAYLAAPGEFEEVLFSPANLPAALRPSADPILAARHAAYAVSLARRSRSAAPRSCAS